MIKGLSADNARPFPQQTAKRKTEKQDNFADQLMGAKSEPSQESPKRTERKASGRDPNREDSRSAEREQDSRSSKSDLRKERSLDARRVGLKNDRRANDERDERDDDKDVHEANLVAPSASPIPQPTNRVPASQDDTAPIVVEKPKDASESQDVKLPDFFSKASLEKGATKDAKADGLPLTETAASLAAMKETEGLTRQEAMENFVTKMNDELGIPPQKLLQAFAQLGDQAMNASPEASIGELMSNLNLDEAGEEKATALYQDLLKTTGDSLVNEKLAGLDGSVKFDVMSPRDHSLRKLSTSLDDMNDSFFKKDAGDPKKAQGDLEAMDVALAKMMREPSMAQAQMVKPGETFDVAVDDADDESVGAVGVNDLGDSSKDLLAALGIVAPASAQAQSQGDGEFADLMGQQQEQSRSVGSTKASLKSAFAEEIAKVDKDKSVETDSVIKPDAKLDPQTILGQDPQIAPGTPKSMLGPADMMMGKQATPKDEQENVKELIKQAQIMVKRGGGEMKMEMKPEGMGSIQLRVNVENGQVSVQMLTESESAKHLLEKGLHELKSNLAQHELKVQSMTVDVGNDVKKDMDQQATQDQQRQKAQQFAQDFMGSFRDEQQGFRQGFLDNKGWRSYGRGKSPDSVQPEQVQRAAQASQSDTSKRLNLVA